MCQLKATKLVIITILEKTGHSKAKIGWIISGYGKGPFQPATLSAAL